MCPAIFSSYSTLLIFSHNNHSRLFFKATPLSINNCALTWHRAGLGATPPSMNHGDLGVPRGSSI